MPVSSLSYSEVNQYRNNDASAAHISTPSSPDSGTDVLLFGRKSGKRRNSTGLNVRLSRMLMRVNTSFASDLVAPGGKRPRNPSNCSSSSTVVSGATETPIDSVHSAHKSNSLGNGFAIIKAGSPPGKARLGFVLNTDVPSWRDTDKGTGEEREKSQRELPGWLSETFSSLEPDHPLRFLARHTCPNTNYEDDAASSGQEHIAQKGPPEETHEETIFAFVPPTANPALPEAASSTTDINEHAFRQYADPVSTYCVVDYGGSLAVPAVELHDNELSIDAHTPEGLVPFSQPGPFSRKTVHFMTPVPSSPLSLSNPASNHSWNQPSLSPTLRPINRSSGYKPYSTPGPASHFSLASSHHSTSDLLSVQEQEQEQEHSSDSLTLTYEAQADDNGSAHSLNEDIDIAGSILSFNSGNNEHSLEKPFSMPGPAFYVPSVPYFSSPNKYAEQAYDDFSLEVEELLSDELDKGQMTHLVAPEHVETIGDQPGLTNGISFNSTSTVEELNPLVAEVEPTMDYTDTTDYALEPEAEPSVLTPTKPEPEPELPAPPIELFSSPPYIRFMETFEEDASYSDAAWTDLDSRTRPQARAPRSKPSSAARTRSRSGYDQAAAVHRVSSPSPYMRLDQLPFPACEGANALPASPRTPQSQPYRTGTTNISGLGRDEAGDPRVLGEAVIDIGPGAAAEEDGMLRKLALEEPKPLRAFAPAPGIYLSPLRDGDSSAGQNTKAANDAGLWYLSLSQLSEDSIENWET